MTTGLWLWFMGYLVVRFKGHRVEKVLNEAAEKGLQLWRIERLTTDIVIARLTVKQFRKLRPILRSNGVTVSILERQGFPFTLNKLSRRAFFAVGLVGVGIVILYLSSYIWFIEVVGNERITTEEIMAVVLEEGVRIGLPKHSLSPNQVETRLLTTFPELSWTHIIIQGSRLRINVVERDVPDIVYEQNGDIVAADDGLITELRVLRGTPLVEEGDTVRKGDVLISSTYYDQWGRRQEGRAEGRVMARMWMESFGEAAYTSYHEMRTGQRARRFRLDLGELTVPLGFRPSFPQYTTEEKGWTWRLGRYVLPVSLTMIDYFAVEYEPRLVPPEIARERALSQAWSDLEEAGVDRSAVKQTLFEEVPIADAVGVRVILRVELEENIGEFQPIS